MGEPSVKVRALGVTLGHARVLDGASMDLSHGTMTAVIGPNGSGKTTLLRALAGLIRPSDGTIDGVTPGNTGYCPQAPACAWDFTMRELCALSPHPEAAVGWCLRLRAGANIDRRLGSLSGGERRLAHIALALATPAEPYGSLILLDEPTADLDAARRELAAEAFLQLRSAGATVVLATHDFALANASDQAVVLSEGRVIACGAPQTCLTDAIVRETWGVAPARR